MGQYARHVNRAVCLSRCGHGPMMLVDPETVWCRGVRESDLPEIVDSLIRGGVSVKRLLADPGVGGANKVWAGS
jgi:(2Fe-2S) ferredoxin